MKSNQIYTVLHVSDFHHSHKKFRDEKIVVDALVNDLREICVGQKQPDLIVFTGDIVHAAGTDSHYEVYDEFLERLSKVTHCEDERIFIVPGNHDAQRKIITENLEFNIKYRGIAEDIEAIDQVYENGEFEPFVDAKFSNYRELEDYLSLEQLVYRNPFASVYRCESLPIELLVLNTAVMSGAGLESLGKDEGVLSLSEFAVRDALTHLQSDRLSIFAMHHPLRFLSENCVSFLERIIQENADILLFGHMHDPNPTSIAGMSGNYLSNQAGAIFTNRRSAYIGYSLISFDAETKHSETLIRTYWNDRSEFDAALNKTSKGIFYSSSEARVYWKNLVKPVDDEGLRKHISTYCLNAFNEEPDDLVAGERMLHDVFVPTPIYRKSVSSIADEMEAGKQRKVVSFDDVLLGNENVLLFALPEHGRTTVLKEFQYSMICRVNELSFPRVPIFLDFEEIKYSKSQLLKTIKGRSLVDPKVYSIDDLMFHGHFCLIVDDVVFNNRSGMKILREFVTEYPKVRYVFSAMENSSDQWGVYATPEMPISFDALELGQLKRSQMRELVTKFQTGADIENVLNRIQNEIQQINLPFTAANGSIFLTIFEQQSGFKPVNRSVLVEQLIDITLSKGAPDQGQRETFDYKNKTSLLTHVAAWMASNNKYTVDVEDLRQLVRDYVDNLGLVVDIGNLLNEFLTARLFVLKQGNRIGFRYKTVLEYFISLQMIDNLAFREWVLDEEQYLRFVNEIQFFAGKVRNDSKLLELIGDRFSEFMHEMQGDIGEFNLQRLEDVYVPKLPKDSEKTIQHLSDQLSSRPLTQDERDEELEVTLPHDVENRQEVYRPIVEHSGAKLVLLLTLYSGVLKNMELVADSVKRRHLSSVWLGWSSFLLVALQLADQIAEKRKIRVDGILYEVAAPRNLTVGQLTRIIALNLPQAVARLVAASLGTEKLQRQLLEPSLDEANQPKIYDFFRVSLIYELSLTENGSALRNVLLDLQSSKFLTEAMVWNIMQLRRMNKISEEAYANVLPSLGEAIAKLAGGNSKKILDEKGKQTSKLRKQDLLLRIQKSQEGD